MSATVAIDGVPVHTGGMTTTNNVIRPLAARVGDWPDIDGLHLEATFDSFAQPLADGPVAFSESACYRCECGGAVEVVFYERIGTAEEIRERVHTVGEPLDAMPAVGEFDLTGVRCECGPEPTAARLRAFDAALPGPTNADTLL